MTKQFRTTTFTIRQDNAPFKFTEEGYLIVTAYASRTGVFDYYKPDGSLYRENRTELEVFNEDSLNTLKNKPLTRLHPRRMLDSTNVTQHIKGITLADVQREDNLIKVTVIVYDKGLISDITSGLMQELSCGYFCELEEIPGTTPEGENFDATQRNIRYNHLAVVPKGRAGPKARLKLDSKMDQAFEFEEDSEPQNNSQPQLNTDISIIPIPETKPKMKIQVNGKDFEVNDDVAAPILAEINALNTQVNQFKADAAFEKARADSINPSEIASAQLTLIGEASKYMKADSAVMADLVKKQPKEIKVIALNDSMPALQVTVNDDEGFVNILYNKMIANVQPKADSKEVPQNDSFDNLGKKLGGVLPKGNVDEVDEAYENYVQANRDSSQVTGII